MLSIRLNCSYFVHLLFYPYVTQISEDIEGAIIYLDAGCTESFQYIGAFPLLLELGVRAICSLENMSSLDAVRMVFHSFRFVMICCATLLVRDCVSYVCFSLSCFPEVKLKMLEI